jgi:hypothetical protein
MSLAGRATAGGGGGGGGGAARPPKLDAMGVVFATPFGRTADAAAAAAGLTLGVAVAPRIAGGGGLDAPGSVRAVGRAADRDCKSISCVSTSTIALTFEAAAFFTALARGFRAGMGRETGRISTAPTVVRNNSPDVAGSPGPTCTVPDLYVSSVREDGSDTNLMLAFLSFFLLYSMLHEESASCLGWIVPRTSVQY